MGLLDDIFWNDLGLRVAPGGVGHVNPVVHRHQAGVAGHVFEPGAGFQFGDLCHGLCLVVRLWGIS
ncbi:hypothetical protein D3C71_2195680 [compost metagenome]